MSLHETHARLHIVTQYSPTALINFARATSIFCAATQEKRELASSAVGRTSETPSCSILLVLLLPLSPGVRNASRLLFRRDYFAL
jgi:hypothetical protein